MHRLFFSTVGALMIASQLFAAPDSVSLALNFGADIPGLNGQNSAVTEAAGVLGTFGWNNAFFNDGNQQVFANFNGNRLDNLGIGASWTFAQTTGSELVTSPNPQDELLMTGHGQSGPQGPGTVDITGLTGPFTWGYDVYVYTFGGILDQGEPNYKYTIEAENLSDTREARPDPNFSGEFVEGFEGNYLLFRNVVGSDFRLQINSSITAIEFDASTYHCPAGDFDKDGNVDEDDINKLRDQIKTGEYDPCYDLNDDGSVDSDDCDVWINDIKNTCAGDANLDGKFDSADLTAVMAAGEFEDGIECNSDWSDGDWNCDGEFSTSDLVFALQQGWYEQGSRPFREGDDGGEQLFESILGDGSINAQLASVPEPSSLILLLVGLIGVVRARRLRL